MLKLYFQDLKPQGGHWSEKSQGNLIFLQGQGKVRKFCKFVREILNIKKVREKSGNFIIWAKNIWVVVGILSIFKCLKMLIFFLTRSIMKVYNDLLENVCPRTFKTFLVFWNCRMGELDKENLSFIGCKKRKRP